MRKSRAHLQTAERRQGWEGVPLGHGWQRRQHARRVQRRGRRQPLEGQHLHVRADLLKSQTCLLHTPAVQLHTAMPKAVIRS